MSTWVKKLRLLFQTVLWKCGWNWKEKGKKASRSRAMGDSWSCLFDLGWNAQYICRLQGRMPPRKLVLTKEGIMRRCPRGRRGGPGQSHRHTEWGLAFNSQRMIGIFLFQTQKVRKQAIIKEYVDKFVRMCVSLRESGGTEGSWKRSYLTVIYLLTHFFFLVRGKIICWE